ncbi:MAG: ABC transporter permease [Bacteroidetes bacterium]|nr:ABC transporter permease [Bacteroidota bacterium]MCL6099543.1 ABC transporter permease [Bacteroidota bacterium]
MAVPLKYTLRNFKTRKLTTGITIAGIALVVFVFAAVLMMAYGVQKTLIATGRPDNVMISRKSSNGEISSIIGGDIRNVIRTLPYIAKDSNGRPIISEEPVVVINLEIKTGGLSNVTVRGVSPEVWELRPQVKIKEGRIFNPSLRELIVGEAVANKFVGAQIGSTVKFAGDNWKIVGVFESNGSGFDSELWGSNDQLLNAFNRGSAVSTITFRMSNLNDFDKIKHAFDSDRRLLQFEPKIEQKFFEEQSEFLAGFIRILGIFITVIFSFGAIIGAMITMYAAVANRTVEIGTMRSLGFSRRSILSAFLLESLTIAMIGCAIGLLLASFLQFFRISTLNFNSFADLSFSFALSPSIIVSSFIFATFMGFFGGFLPSIRAARLNIVNALRGG